MGVTIREVAARCGLSVSTVSKAFRDYPDVSAQTRELVLDTAREMGYYANALARTLSSSRAFCLGAVVQEHNGLTEELWAGFREKAENSGYDVLLMTDHLAHTGMSLLEHCRHRRVDGAALLSADFASSGVHELMSSDIPCVTVEHAFSNRSCVQSEHIVGMEALVEYAVALGHRRIALVYGQPSSVTEQRLAGFHRGMQRQGLTVRSDYLVQGHYGSQEAGGQAVMSLMRLPQPPTCILLPDDLSCLGAVEATEALGLQVGRELSLAGFGGLTLLQRLHPRLTTIAQDARSMGRRAAQLLMERISHPETAAGETSVIPCQLLRGETIGPWRDERVG